MISNAPHQILTRIGWLLLSLLAVFFCALGALHLIERRGWHEIVADETEKHSRLLDLLLTQKGKPLRLFTESYARRTSFTRPLNNPVGAPPLRTLLAGLKTFEIHAAWVLEADGSVRLMEGNDATILAGPPPLSPAQIKSLVEPAVAFYLERASVLYRVRGVRLSPDATRRDQPPGWLFAVLRWEESDLRIAQNSLEGQISLLPPAEVGQPGTEEKPVRVERILRDFELRPLRLLRFEYRPSPLDVAEASDWLEVLVMTCFGLIMLGVLAVCLVRWVLQPAGALRAILEQRDPTALAPLIAAGGYTSELAQLVQQSMETQTRLEHTLDDRARLGRELHDGALQTLYAAGMALAAASATMRAEPAAAERILDDTRAELNATIADLRGFLLDLETVTLPDRKFSDSVLSMTSLVESTRALGFTLQIDDTVAAGLPVAERTQFLQIVREAVSNAARHSGASTVIIRLQSEATDVVLEISDDGHGFDPLEVSDAGRGLANFQARAKDLGADISVFRNAGGGTTVRLKRPPQVHHA